MKRLPLGPLYYEFSRHNEPRLRIQPGETIVVETEDAFSGQIRTNDDRRDKTKKPVWQSADGADLGRRGGAGRFAGRDDPRDQAVASASAPRGRATPSSLREWLGTECPHGTHVCPIKDGKIHWSDELTIPYHADARLHRHRAGHGRAHDLPRRPARRQHGHHRSLPRQHRLSAGLRPRRLPLPGRCPRGDGARRALGQRPGNAGRNDDHRQPASRAKRSPARGSNRPPRS